MTDNERDAQTIRALWPSEHHRLCDSRKGEECDCYMRPYADADPALARLVAALSAATTDRDEALADRDGARRGEDEAWEKWQVAERRAEALAAQLQQAREALREIVGVCTYPRDSMRSRVNDCIERGERVLSIASSALAAAAPATTLNEPEGEA